MTDIVSKKTRSKMMSSVRSSSKLEDRICSDLWNAGFRFRRNVKKLFGKPDIAIQKYKIVIFIDSCFWHYCDIHGQIPQQNSDFWTSKLSRNKERDHEVTQYYKERGWNILRIWEHDLKQNYSSTFQYIQKFICEKRMIY
ncbi:very short patch repair endonuclease [Paenibacillus ihbetae]|uniref:Very short patch repair endonuclease n=1 Tax=Paenibacillus ihbetae TaxID=1870820 RepID=A0ABX3JPG0_9BACL|nr:very short patch repair endonuclease [Paenibacillus ihbetae]OOC58737.1 very short patch repair endonuclease [Paenibacillus ihbetae]